MKIQCLKNGHMLEIKQLDLKQCLIKGCYEIKEDV